MRFGNFITVIIQIVMLWVLTPCSLKRVYWRFGRSCFFCLVYKCMLWWWDSWSLRKVGGATYGLLL